ncbi:MAG: hypothetical protein Kow0042_13230 [Calditrichia bacterium]
MKNQEENTRISHYLFLAREFKTQFLLHKAAQTLEQALKEYPDNPQLMIALAHIYFEMGSQFEARQIILKLVRSGSKNGHVYFLLGRIAASRGKVTLANRNFYLALKKGVSPILVLKKYIPYLLQQGKANLSMELLRSIHPRYQREPWFVLLLTNILLQMHKKVQALQILRLALKNLPHPEVLLNYIRLKFKVDNQDPLIIYQLLKKECPETPTLSEQTLHDLHLDYLIFRGRIQEAENTLLSDLNMKPQKMHWMKRLMELKQIQNNSEEYEKWAITYLIGNPDDFQTMREVEKFYISQFRLPDWLSLLRKIFHRHPTNLRFFQYLRFFFQNRNWLQSNTLTSGEFFGLVENMNFHSPDIKNTDWKCLPSTIFEYLCLNLNFTNELLKPDALYSRLFALQDQSAKLLPFDLTDLDAAHPIWIFALHFYYLFKTVLPTPVSFNPDLFRHYGISVILKFPAQSIALDISPLLGINTEYPENWFQQWGIKILRWPPQYLPQRQISGIPLFEEKDLSPILYYLKSQLYTLKQEKTHD